MKYFAFVIALLAACGGGAVTMSTPAPAPAPSPAASAPAPTAPVIVTPAWSTNWAEVWSESWGSPSLGGWLRGPDGPECGNVNADAGMTGATNGEAWAPINTPAFTLADGHIVIDQQQTAGTGWAMLSTPGFGFQKPLRLTGVVELEKHEGAWLGLTLLQNGSKYREIALRWRNGLLLAQRYTPCEITDLAVLPPGPHPLALEWWPGRGWRYLVGDVELYVESHTSPGAQPNKPLHVGLFVVHVGADLAPGTVGTERARVGRLLLQAGDR